MLGNKGLLAYLLEYWSPGRVQGLHVERNEEDLAIRKNHCPDLAPDIEAWNSVIVRLTTLLPILVSSLLKWEVP